jgi:hypothetical protein
MSSCFDASFNLIRVTSEQQKTKVDTDCVSCRFDFLVSTPLTCPPVHAAYTHRALCTHVFRVLTEGVHGALANSAHVLRVPGAPQLHYCVMRSGTQRPAVALLCHALRPEVIQNKHDLNSDSMRAGFREYEKFQNLDFDARAALCSIGVFGVGAAV